MQTRVDFKLNPLNIVLHGCEEAFLPSFRFFAIRFFLLTPLL